MYHIKRIKTMKPFSKLSKNIRADEGLSLDAASFSEVFVFVFKAKEEESTL